MTHDEAIDRARLVNVESYHVDLDLSGAPAGMPFGSVTTVRFSCAEPGAATFVELKPVEVQEIRLNGVPVDPAALDGNRLPLAGLRADNELVVRCTMAYSTTGEGVHRFTDPEDGEVYLYAQACLDDAQRIFACFDQPDLKATMTLAVSAPPDWTVRANAPGEQVRPGRWEFAGTLPLSTYLMTVVAGPYHTRQAEHDGIPLALLCRRSLAPYLDKDAEEIFAVTGALLDHFHGLFGIRYPFGDYVQAFVPEFNAGAMENPGCVTFREEFLHRSAATDSELELRTMVIAHEMTHMWFGDLVTMRWWDDLWLNESFAEYMGWRATAEVTRFTGAWTSFAIVRKSGGYAADQRPSTHPIAPERVADTEQALLNFDGISYAKGASALRQLVAWLGDEAFFAGLRAYFAAHAYGNATLADLLAALSAASGRDLSAWADVWLRRPQVNTLRPEAVTGPDGRYGEVAVRQAAPPGYPTLRPHRIGVGVYAEEGGRVTLAHRAEVDLDPEADGGRTPVPQLAGVPAGRLLLLNDGDLTFAKVGLLPQDRAVLAEVLPALADPLARALTWAAAMEMTRDAEMPAAEFLALAGAGLPAEDDVAVFAQMLRFARETVADRHLPPAARPAALAALAGACQNALDAGRPDAGGRRLTALRGLVSCAGPELISRLRGWPAGRDVPAGLEIDADLRWAMLGRLVVLDAAGEPEIAAECERDRSARGAEHAARCRAALPGAAAKARAWELIVGDGPLRLVAAVAGGFWHPEQAADTAPYVARYFAEMPAVAARRTPNVVPALAHAAYPRYAVTAETLAAAEAMIAVPDLDPGLRRAAIDATDDLRRALAARTLT
ncbi:aminopeptidase [Sphaerisporangium rufum]|uniref:Aminopeptidase N n=1 Tax=Sphaerisporangium rufum TaxID=1381558 RepID=A0A919R8J0_9ACTN|nr:aminopeptidase [Sphaerisporangium rufum]